MNPWGLLQCSGSVHEWFEKTYAGRAAQDKLAQDLMDLDAYCRTLLGKETSTYQEKVPAKSALKQQTKGREVAELVAFRHRLWQIGYAEGYHLKGGACLHAIRDNMQTIVYGKGPKTHTHPIQGHHAWPHPDGRPTPTPADPIENFSMAVGIGSAVTMSHFCVCVFGMRGKILESPGMDQETQKYLAGRLIQCLVLQVTCDSEGSVADMMLDALINKIEAAKRTRPTMLSFRKVYSTKAEEHSTGMGINSKQDQCYTNI